MSHIQITPLRLLQARLILIIKLGEESTFDRLDIHR